MKSFAYTWVLQFIGAAVILQSFCLADCLADDFSEGEEIIWRSPSGLLSTLQVAPNESFFEVIEQIQNQIEIEEPNLFSYEKSLNAPEYFLDFMAMGDKKKQSAKIISRSYEDPLDASERENIFYIVTTLGNAGLLDIRKARSKLKEAGKRIEQVHPLRFLAYIFTNEELKAAIHNMDGRTFIWSEFTGGLKGSLTEEYDAKNLLQYIPEFASDVKINLNIINPLVREQKWKEFINALLTQIPRQGNSARYDM